MPALVALLLAAARPLPDPADLREGQRATQCVHLYRLQPTAVPTDSAGCEDAGYGLEFMRERDGEIRALEQKHADELAHAREEAAARTEARAHRAELEEPCRELAFDAGPGPDGGALLCARAGWTPTVFAARLGREQSQQRLRDQERLALLRRLVLGAGSVGLLAFWLWRRRRRVSS